MNIFQKNMSIREMWKLHLLLRSSNRDNILFFLKELSPESLLEALKIMYKKVPKINLATHFINGLEKFDFFSFEEFVKVFKQ